MWRAVVPCKNRICFWCQAFFEVVLLWCKVTNQVIWLLFRHEKSIVLIPEVLLFSQSVGLPLIIDCIFTAVNESYAAQVGAFILKLGHSVLRRHQTMSFLPLKYVHDRIRCSSFSSYIPTAIAQVISLLNQYSSSSFTVLFKNSANKGEFILFVNAIILYLFSVLEVFFYSAIMFLISDFNA